jgi:hypothetical protein
MRDPRGHRFAETWTQQLRVPESFAPAPCLIEKRRVNRCIAYGLFHLAESLARGKPSAANAFDYFQPDTIAGTVPLRMAARKSR